MSDVVVAFDESILRVTINRPEKRNALSLAVLGEIEDIFSRFAPAAFLRMAILTGAGDKAFAAGGDVAELMAFRTKEAAERISLQGKAALNAIRTFPVPVIACVNGLALGGGAELAAACDMRYGAAWAKIGFIHAKLAITPSWGGSIDLVRLVGPSAAAKMIARGELLTAGEARQAGLFDDVCPEDIDLEAGFAAFLEPMLERPAQVMRAVKALTRQKVDASYDELSICETAHFTETWVHDDHWLTLKELAR
jgi:enoyl-CoA hydratase